MFARSTYTVPVHQLGFGVDPLTNAQQANLVTDDTAPPCLPQFNAAAVVMAAVQVAGQGRGRRPHQTAPAALSSISSSHLPRHNLHQVRPSHL